MAIRVQRHANVNKQATLLDGFDVSQLKWRVCGCGFNRFVHEGMNHISNVEVHVKTRSGNVSIFLNIHMTIHDRMLFNYCSSNLQHFCNECANNSLII